MSNDALVVELDERKIDAIFVNLDQCQRPGAAVGIAIGGKPMYRKGFGLASMELPVALSPTIRMRIASTTKHFTCLAYMLLCEDGKAGLDDSIGTHLPELHPVTHDVTMRQLMGNIGGLRDVFDICFQFSGIEQRVSSEELLSLYRDIEDVNARPGSAWVYNNGGFLILSVAIERIASQPLEDVLRDRIFGPVGMYASLLRRFDTDFVPNSASAHVTNPAGGYEKSYLRTAFAGEGGIVSSVDDMLRWLAHMDAPVVGTSATWRLMKAPQRLVNGTSTGYGFGLMSGGYRNVETLYHDGGWSGGSAQMLKVPAAGLDVVIMVNRSDVSATLLAERVLDACLPGLDPVEEPRKRPLASGIFRSKTTNRVVQLFSKDGQQIVSIDGWDLPVLPDVDGVLWPVGIFRYLKQSVTLVGDPSTPASVRLCDFGNVHELAREKAACVSDLGAVAGLYRAHSIDTQARITAIAGGAQLVTSGRFGAVKYRLECLSDRIWRAKATGVWWLGGILLFDEDYHTFHFSTYRTLALTFRREA